MSTVVVVGAQWGDEGKGKIVDCLTEKAHMVARYQGGHNAGHTVAIDGGGTFILHLIPSGILRPGKLCLIGNGTVVDPFCLIKELDGLREKGIEAEKSLRISKGAHLIMPYHMAIEAKDEATKGARAIGTTGRGIGPAYSEKTARTGLRVVDLLYPDTFKEKLKINIAAAVRLIGDPSPDFDSEQIFKDYMQCAERLKECIADTDVLLDNAIEQGQNILFEGAQGTLLDIDHGTFPFVTSSNSTAGGVCTGLGVGPTKIDRVLGIVKAYTTRVGSGPFPTEIEGPLQETLRERGAEFGATTGRPRRCGWLDIVALRHAVRVNGMTGMALTKLDILSNMQTLKLCTSYSIDGQTVTEFPKEVSLLEKAEPIYETLPGWTESTLGINDFAALPNAAKTYIKTIEEMLGVQAQMISTGHKRNELITIAEQF